MLLGFKTELKLNNTQRTQLLQHCGVSRHAWNWGLALTKQILDHNQFNPTKKIRFPSAIDLHKWLVVLVKPECPWYYECSKSSPQEALRSLRTAWDRCFKKISLAPNFKKKGLRDHFTLEGVIKFIAGNKIQVPKIGILKTYERLPQLKPKSVSISRQANRWFISFRFDVEQQESRKTTIVGVDLGVKVLATLSTGEAFIGAKSYKSFEAKLSRMQWLHRHKVKGSANWKKAQIEIARLHRKIANIRKDTLHKLTTLLAKNHGTIVIEDLNVSGLMANHKLSKAITDMGFFEFRRQLNYKCELYGSKLVVVDRWFPSSKTCSNCGIKKERLSLSERVFNCEHCGKVIDRDLNAALILSKVVS
ncbi:MAG: IS200/IS605 family element transposase accessory protein TnpB [Nostoc sp. NOS(2021)]|uniref:RNA-guided endonuclease InsQ/TnpB family protein n=1 Tax=Nostoc sp. NOS(2021) TaxID=2815407 RepID=UPI0025E2F691|nr:RNA-guided endonuclease TnpB family protein [Nostoc sp. NOS(2021)]MBN3895389.1 IS200/IS605 family element transposase accessory protein TnpB [Nostoc sp. NOS(2021)]